MVKERNYGIDLLRLVLMFMVCMLHTLKQGGILNASPVGTVRYIVFWSLEIICFCAVDCFAIISGYMASNRKQRYSKLPEMWFQVFFYSFILTCFGYFTNFYTCDKSEMIKLAFPVTFNVFWYFTAYFALFLAMPLLNKFLFSIEEATAKKAFIIVVVFFVLLESIADSFRYQGGYSAIWIMVLYCMGVLAKRIKLFEKRKTRFLIFLLALSVLLTVGIFIIFNNHRNFISGLFTNIFPTMAVNGLLLAILFSRLKIKNTLCIKIINKLSPLAFGIYLFQLSPVIWQMIIRDRFLFVASENVFVGILYAFGLAAAIFVAGLIVEFIRFNLAKLCRIPKLSELIVNGIDKLITKCFVFLK